jgi:hypothetical protein
MVGKSGRALVIIRLGKYARGRGLAFFVILGYGEVGNSQRCYCNAKVPFETASLVRQLLARAVLGSSAMDGRVAGQRRLGDRTFQIADLQGRLLSRTVN